MKEKETTSTTGFLSEVLEYNSTLRSEGITVIVGSKHGDKDKIHFIYTLEDNQHDLLIDIEPTDYTQWSALNKWIDDNRTRGRG